MVRTPKRDVEGIAPIIISASRATEILALYPDGFMHWLREAITIYRFV
jgi:hypothetical protein